MINKNIIRYSDQRSSEHRTLAAAYRGICGIRTGEAIARFIISEAEATAKTILPRLIVCVEQTNEKLETLGRYIRNFICVVPTCGRKTRYTVFVLLAVEGTNGSEGDWDLTVYEAHRYGKNELSGRQAVKLLTDLIDNKMNGHGSIHGSDGDYVGSNYYDSVQTLNRICSFWGPYEF